MKFSPEKVDELIGRFSGLAKPGDGTADENAIALIAAGLTIAVAQDEMPCEPHAIVAAAATACRHAETMVAIGRQELDRANA